MEMSSYELELAEIGIKIPSWINAEITVCTVEAIVQGGCSPGTYMPAVTYHTARQTMDEHGDEVIRYLEDMGDGSLRVPLLSSWSGLACDLLSMAVETWAGYVWDDVLEAVAEREDD